MTAQRLKIVTVPALAVPVRALIPVVSFRSPKATMQRTKLT